MVRYDCGFFLAKHLSKKYSAALVWHRMNKLIFRIWHNDLTHIIHVCPYGWIDPNKGIRMLLILIILLFQTSFYTRNSRNWQLFYVRTHRFHITIIMCRYITIISLLLHSTNVYDLFTLYDCYCTVVVCSYTINARYLIQIILVIYFFYFET